MARHLTFKTVTALTGRPDVFFAAFVVALGAILVVPLPATLLDGLIATNLTLSALIVIAALLAKDALSISTFPTILLLTTLLRLALNISTTRLVLTEGKAGKIVEAFGHFVIRDDVVVGLVLFLTVTTVQLLVIAKGAERVAEIAARFALDAMPGRQMAIDAAVRAGAQSEDEAERRRIELGRESQLFGAMDGAMKFVKGDAIAGIAITAINLVAGLAIGMTRMDMTFGEAIMTYAVLSVGDGLVAQVPALFTTLSAGILTTRVRSKDGSESLAQALKVELIGDTRTLVMAAAVALGLALAPGFPFLWFLALFSTLVGVVVARHRAERRTLANRRASDAQARADFKQKLEARVAQAKAQRALADELAPVVVPICLDLDPSLTSALGIGRSGAHDADGEFVGDLLPQIRQRLYLESGVRVPAISVRGNVPHEVPGGYTISIREVPVFESAFAMDEVFVFDDVERLRRLGTCGRSGEVAGWVGTFVSTQRREILTAAGMTVLDVKGIVALNVTYVLRKHLRQFLGLQEVSELIDRLEKVFPALVKEVVPRQLGMSQVLDVLRRLVDEQVSIRDLRAILEALSEHATTTPDTAELAERARMALSLQIAHAHVGNGKHLRAVILDPVVEDTLGGAIVGDGPHRGLSLEPEVRCAILSASERAFGPMLAAGLRPVVLTRAAIRRFVRAFYEPAYPDIAVLSYEELPGDLFVTPLGRVLVAEGADP